MYNHFHLPPNVISTDKALLQRSCHFHTTTPPVICGSETISPSTSDGGAEALSQPDSPMWPCPTRACARAAMPAPRARSRSPRLATPSAPQPGRISPAQPHHRAGAASVRLRLRHTAHRSSLEKRDIISATAAGASHGRL